MVCSEVLNKVLAVSFCSSGYTSARRRSAFLSLAIYPFLTSGLDWTSPVLRLTGNPLSPPTPSRRARESHLPPNTIPLDPLLAVFYEETHDIVLLIRNATFLNVHLPRTAPLVFQLMIFLVFSGIVPHMKVREVFAPLPLPHLDRKGLSLRKAPLEAILAGPKV